MDTVIKQIHTELEHRGMQARIVSVSRLEDLRNEIEDRHAQGLFNEAFYQEALSFFSFRRPDDLPNAASLIVVAVPRPQTQVRFTMNDTTRVLVMPPYYRGFFEIPRKTDALLTESLAPEGYRLAPARLPRKLLAVRSGLAEYGCNNIAYVSGMGSFLQLVVFFSDLPCHEDSWRTVKMMDRCRDCPVCQAKCPTGAIASDRFLLRAEQCLVFHNERSAEYPFPDWIDPAWHNCLIGCMLCQKFCPENKPFLNWFEGNESFSHEETLRILRGTTMDALPKATREKLGRLGLLGCLDILPRNLGVFLN